MFREGLRPPDPFRELHPFEAAKTQDGMSLQALAALGPVLVVCLPALGGRPCRRLLRELAARRRAIEQGGTRIAVVHMGGDEDAKGALEPFELHYLARVADPERRLYEHFALRERSRALRAPVQLPGVFLLESGEVTRAELERFD